MIFQVQLANFRSHKLTNISLAPFTVLLGSMGVGKTSILHAISLVLCGQNPLVNAKSEGLRREVRLGESEFHIGLRLDDGTVLDKKVTEAKHSVGINGNYADVKIQKGKILGKLGVELEDVVLCLLDPTPYFRRKEETQRKVLMTFMSTKAVAAPPLVRQLGFGDSFTSVGTIDALIKEIKEEKIRDLNREIKTLNAQIPAPIWYDPTKKEALESRLSEMGQRRDEILREQAREDEWRKTSEMLEKRLAALPVPDPKVSVAALEQEEKDQRAKLMRLKEEWPPISRKCGEAKEQRNSIQAEITRLSDIVTTLEGLGKSCPTCQRELKAEDKKKLLQTINDQRVAKGFLLRDAQAEVDKLNADLEQRQKDGEAQGKKVEEASRQRLDAVQTAMGHEQAKKALEDHRATQRKEGNWPAALAAVAGDIAAANIDLLEAQKREDSYGQREIQVALVRSKETAAEKLDSAAKELAELKDKILNESSGGFIADMQTFMNHFDLGDVKFTLEPFGFSVGGVYADQLSGGQKVILEAALRQAAAKASGLRIMALDDANMLTEGTRQKLAGVLMASAVQTIVCSMTDKEPVIAAPLPKTVKMYWLTSPSLIGPTSVKQLGL